MSERDTPVPCPECGEKGNRVPSIPQFILKGDDWAGKNARIKTQMADKNKKLTARQEEMKKDAPSVTLAPNVDGERVDSWSDAQKLAKAKGKNADSYTPLVEKEKKGN
jgi:hypothetical protein